MTFFLSKISKSRCSVRDGWSTTFFLSKVFFSRFYLKIEVLGFPGRLH